MPVTGFGGFFFRARDPAALAAWYATHLGVGPAEGLPFWPTAAGPLLFQPFAADSDYVAADQPFMLNFRVTGIAEMIAGLRAAGIAVETRETWDSGGFGLFARLHDPEGHPIRAVAAAGLMQLRRAAAPARGGAFPRPPLSATARPCCASPI